MKHLTSLLKGTNLVDSINSYASFYYNSNDIREGGAADKIMEIANIENELWPHILDNPDDFWNKRISTGLCVLSCWVPRVPGLYYTAEAIELRYKALANNPDSSLFKVFNPQDKTRLVMGGIGTIKLPPDDNGWRLFSICTNGDTSGSLPVLIAPEVIDYYNLREGNLIWIKKAKWQELPKSWQYNFPVLGKIPKGALIVRGISELVVAKNEPRAAVYAHPFSIMKYEYKDTLLYDYVYCTIDGIENGNRKNNAERFFKDYANKNGRNGKYLFCPDSTYPLFEAKYMSPSEIRHPSELAHVELMKKRIQEIYFNKTSLEKLIEVLPKHYQSSTSIITLARNIGFNVALLAEDASVSMSAQLINKCFEKDLIENLVERITKDYPQIFD